MCNHLLQCSILISAAANFCVAVISAAATAVAVIHSLPPRSDLLFTVQEQLVEDIKQRIADLMAMEKISTWTLVSHAQRCGTTA
jgi:hypothetical protein